MRTPRRDENGLRKGSWTPEEDQKLIEYIKRYRIWNWALMAKFAGLSRSGKSCRLRWVNYLNPELKHGKITKEEEDTISSVYSELGSRWSAIAARLPGRTDNQIKNYWHTHLKRRFEEKTVPKIEAEGIEVHNFEANNVLNSNEAHQVTTLVSAPESSNSQGSDNLPMMSPNPYIFVGESSSSSTSSSVRDIHEIDDANADSSRLNRDLRCFWTQPFSFAEEWYQEPPSSPYGFYNSNDYWFQFLLEGDREELNVTA